MPSSHPSGSRSASPAFLRRVRTRRCLALAAAVVVGCAPVERAPDADTVALEPGAVRQPVPPGIDPRMVEWRSDGVLIASRDSLLKTPGYVVDSVFPPDEARRRFLATIPGPVPDRLQGGARSVDALLRAYHARLVARDTAALGSLVVTKAEFGHLYLPVSPEVTAGMQPAIAWLLFEETSARGGARILERVGGDPASVVGTTCRGEPTRLDGISLRGPCGVIVQRSGRRDTLWLANRVIERNGVAKLFGLANPY